LESIDGLEVIMIPVRIENIGEDEVSLGFFFNPTNGIRYIYPNGVQVSVVEITALNTHFRISRNTYIEDYIYASAGGYPYNLEVGGVIYRHLHMLYDGDGDYIFNIIEGTNIRFPISKN